MINRKTRLSKLIELWFQVFFYSIGITTLFFFLMRYHVIPNCVEIDALQWLTSLTPILRNSWWYASCYFGLYLLIPIINRLILNSNKSKVLLFLVISICIVCASSIIYGDGLCVKFGYSVTWLVILYVLGAFIRLYDIKGKKCLYKWGGIVLLTWALALLIDIVFVYDITGEAKSGRILALYTSPFTIYASVQLFLLFSSMEAIKSEYISSVIKKIAIATFGIYLIHTHDVIWDYFADYLKVNNNIFVIVIVTLCTSLGVFFACMLIDILRQYLFAKINVRGVTERISCRIAQVYTKYIQKHY